MANLQIYSKKFHLRLKGTEMTTWKGSNWLLTTFWTTVTRPATDCLLSKRWNLQKGRWKYNCFIRTWIYFQQMLKSMVEFFTRTCVSWRRSIRENWLRLTTADSLRDKLQYVQGEINLKIWNTLYVMHISQKIGTTLQMFIFLYIFNIFHRK
jgi:hypothetical protein